MLARVLDDRVHRFDELRIPRQRSAARPEFVARKVQAVNSVSVARKKSAQKIQIVFGARITVPGYNSDFSRAPRFVA